MDPLGGAHRPAAWRDRAVGREVRTLARRVTSPPCVSSPVSQLRGLSLLMDLIRLIQALLEPLVEQASFFLTDFAPLDIDAGARFGFLEYRGTRNDDGRIVQLGFYQLARRRT